MNAKIICEKRNNNRVNDCDNDDVDNKNLSNVSLCLCVCLHIHFIHLKISHSLCILCALVCHKNKIAMIAHGGLVFLFTLFFLLLPK